MRINVCIPTRGKKAYLQEYVPLLLKRSYMPETRVVLGFDMDDPEGFAFFEHEKVIHSVQPREDSLGAKYNRCAKEWPADLYLMWVDDIEIVTDGWDIVLDAMLSMVPDGIAAFTFGKEPNGEYLPSGFGVTQRVVDAMGFLAPPYFPFWWHNTWVWEVGEIAGRLIPVAIQTKYPKVLPPSPRRDIAFWGRFFDETRHFRVAAGRALIEASDDQAFRKYLYQMRIPRYVRMQEERNKTVRAPSFEAILNAAGTNIPEPIDERHVRLREQAESLLAKGALVPTTKAQLELELPR